MPIHEKIVNKSRTLAEKLSDFIDRYDQQPGNGLVEAIPGYEVNYVFISDFKSVFSDDILSSPRQLHGIGRQLSNYLDWDGTKLFVQMLFSNCDSSVQSILCKTSHHTSTLHDQSNPITMISNPDYYLSIIEDANYLSRNDPRKAKVLLNLLTNEKIRLLSGSVKERKAYAFAGVHNNDREIYVTKEMFGLTYASYKTFKLTVNAEAIPFRAETFTDKLEVDDNFKMSRVILSHEITHLDQMGNGDDVNYGICNPLQYSISGFRYDFTVAMFVKTLGLGEDYIDDLHEEGLYNALWNMNFIMEEDAELRAFIDVYLTEPISLTRKSIKNCTSDTIAMARFCFPDQWTNFDGLRCVSDPEKK